MIKIGLIHSIDEENRLFSMRFKNKIEYFYLQNGLFKKFQRYLDKKVFVEFDCSDEKEQYNHICAYKINFFTLILPFKLMWYIFNMSASYYITSKLSFS